MTRRSPRTARFEGTPRGIVAFSQVLALRDGGYIVSGSTSDGAGRLLAFDSHGRIDTSFGRNGMTPIGELKVTQLLEQPDGKILVVGTGPSPVLAETNKDLRNSVVRLLPSGTIDRTYGDNGWVEVNVANHLEDSEQKVNEITSASLDESGRLLLANTTTVTNLDDANSLATSTTLQRFGGNGQADRRFVGKRVNRDSSEAGAASLDVLPAISVTRSDGQIVVSTRKRAEPNFPIDLTLRGAYAQVPPERVVHSALITDGVFVVRNLADGVIAAVEDNKIVVAGSLIEGTDSAPVLVPVLIRFDENLHRDFTFGTNGYLHLPTTGGAVEAAEVAHNPDGTLTSVLAAPRSDDGSRVGNPTVVRVFQDDRPVVAFRAATRKSGQIRVTNSIRGINDINSASIDNKDVSLVDKAGGRAKARLLSLVQQLDGDYLATYRFARTRGTFSVVSVGGQIEDADLVNRQSTIAMITI